MDFSKIENIQKNLSKEEIFLVLNKSDIFYLTGKNVDGVSLVITGTGEKYCLVSKMLFSQTKKIYEENNFFDNKSFIVGDNLILQLKSLPVRFKKISVQKDISYSLYNLLSRNWRIKVKDIIGFFRQKKSFDEIENIKKAISITNRVLRETIKILKLGVKEIEVKKYILKKFLDYNVEPSFEPIVAFDENTAYPHHISCDKKLSKNSFVLIDIGCKFNGYCSDITRMFFVDRDSLVSYFYKKLFELQKSLISMCVVGRKVSEIDFFAKEFFRKLQIEKNYLHSTGHSVGIDIHETPRVSINDKTILKEGMVITIEPGIYFDRENFLPEIYKVDKYKNFGLRIEDMILITKIGPKVLTR